MRARSRFDTVTGVVGDAAGALRRRREARRPYARLYDETGAVRTLDPASGATQALIETAGSMVDIVGPAPPGRRSEEA